MDVIVAALCGIGLAMIWRRAVPLKPVREWLIIRLQRRWEKAIAEGEPKFILWIIWFPKAGLGCEECVAPWCAWAVAGAMLLGWQSLLAGPAAFAIYCLGMRLPDKN